MNHTINPYELLVYFCRRHNHPFVIENDVIKIGSYHYFVECLSTSEAAIECIFSLMNQGLENYRNKE